MPPRETHAQPGEERREEVNVAIDPAIMGPPAEDPELVSVFEFKNLSKLAEYS